MPRRFLFGPVPAAVADSNLPGAPQSPDCLFFNAHGDADMTMRPDERWTDLCARFPAGWRPDFIVLWLAGANIPPCLWSAPVPLVGVAPDGHLRFHWYRRCLRRVDLMVTDMAGVEPLAREQIGPVTAANLAIFNQHGEEERQAIVSAARDRHGHDGPAAGWEEILVVVDREWSELTKRAARRSATVAEDDLQEQLWQALGNGVADAGLVARLVAAVEARQDQAALHHALGLASVITTCGLGPVSPGAAKQVAGHFRKALDCDSGHVLAGLNLAEALLIAGAIQPAVQQARQTLASLPQTVTPGAAWLEAGHLPGFEPFRVEWERAAWANAGRPPAEAGAKVTLVRWRLHTLLAGLTGDLVHYFEAALARPDLPVTRAALGCALARAGRLVEGMPHLHQAVAANPFDRPAAHALYDALGAAGDTAGQRRLARDRRLLAQAAPQVVPEEPWFAQTPPLGDELASLVILCCDQLDATRACLESVLAHTRAPYELILVDNASRDGTPAYLEEIKTRAGPARVGVLRNEANQGFAVGCNQGLAVARGRYVVLLNNDTVVTAGWLDGLVACALSDGPNVGLVGPVTSYAAPPQEIPVDYHDAAGLTAFAARRRTAYAGQTLPVKRLTGFCLLLRRELLDRIGTLDERFGLGFFEDDDLCVRAREAGFGLRVALDVFVHHEGSRTFRGLGIDCVAKLQENFVRFQDKWGPERTAGYRLPEPNNGQPPRTARARVSLCLIVKNEEANLPDCLASAADLVDEVIVVDTGSTDTTRDIAIRMGARVVDFPWVNSFAAARNENLRHATGAWVFWLDADDRIDQANRTRLLALFDRLPDEGPTAYVMKCVCLPDLETGQATEVDHVRLFRNHPRLRWEHRVHEQILPAVRRLGGDVILTDIRIEHTGYLDPALRRRKLDRDLRLLKLEEAEQPEHPFTLFNLGCVLQERGSIEDALGYFRRSLERSQPSDSIVRKLYALIAQGHRQLGQHQESLAACQAGRAHYPDDSELLFREALARIDLRDLEGAAANLERLLETAPGAYLGSVVPGIRGYLARQNLAEVYRDLGRLREAEAQWRAVLAEQPDYRPALLGLADVLLAQGSSGELEELAQRLNALPGGTGEGAVVRARGLLAAQEYAPARRILEEAIIHHSQALWPRVILSHVLLQEGRDGTAAEEALRGVLALDPHHVEASRNLALLIQRQHQNEA